MRFHNLNLLSYCLADEYGFVLTTLMYNCVMFHQHCVRGISKSRITSHYCLNKNTTCYL